MKKNLLETKFEELKNRSFKLIQVVEMLCEVCEKPLTKKEKFLKNIEILTEEDYKNVKTRAGAHDRAEVDFDEGKIYFYDHDFPGDIHTYCIEKL